MEQQQAKPLQQSTRSRFFSVDTWTSVCAGGRVNADVRMDAARRGPWPSFPGHLLPHRPSRLGQHAAPRGSPGLPGHCPWVCAEPRCPLPGEVRPGCHHLLWGLSQCPRTGSWPSEFRRTAHRLSLRQPLEREGDLCPRLSLLQPQRAQGPMPTGDGSAQDRVGWTFVSKASSASTFLPFWGVCRSPVTWRLLTRLQVTSPGRVTDGPPRTEMKLAEP